MKESKRAREVATEIHKAASRADDLEAYDTELFVRIPGIGLRPVKRVRLDEDAFVILDLDWMKGDIGKAVAK